MILLFFSSINLLRLLKDVDEVECEQTFAHLSEETRGQLDDPALMCMPVVPKSLSEYDTLRKSEYPKFPETHSHVGKDPMSGRMHVLVVGPESSGSHFIMRNVAATFGLQKVTEDTFTNAVVLYHISQPQGGYCGHFEQVPLLDDFGCMPGGCAWKRGQGRVIVDVVSTVQHYLARGESIKVVQVIRDPEISILANSRSHHCVDRDVNIKENAMAFNLLFQAKDLPEVTTICYEQLVQEGKTYLAERLKTAGFKEIDVEDFLLIRSGNSKYTAINRTCTFSDSAYMALCPTSPHTKALSKMGCM